MAAMTITLLPGYPDRVGKRFIWAGSCKGSSSYATGGDTIALPGFQNYIDVIDSGGQCSVSGTYFYRAIPSAGGKRPTWKLKMFAVATPQTEVTNATDLSGETFQVSGFGGTY